MLATTIRMFYDETLKRSLAVEYDVYILKEKSHEVEV